MGRSKDLDIVRYCAAQIVPDAFEVLEQRVGCTMWDMFDTMDAELCIRFERLCLTDERMMECLREAESLIIEWQGMTGLIVGELLTRKLFTRCMEFMDNVR
jgi:hypothetical protein